MFKLTPPQAQQPKHVSLTDFIRDSKKAKGRRSGSPSSPDLNWASSERGKKRNLDSDSNDDDDDNCSSVDDKIDRGVVQRKRSSSKSSSSSLSSSTSTQAQLLSTIVFLILLFSSVDNDLLPASLSSFAEHIIFPERFMTPRSSFRFFKLPHFGFIALVSYLLITLIFSVISTLYQSRLASTISKSISKLFVRPRQQVDERTTAARPHSSALTSNNVIEEESDSICSDCGRPWSMHEDWGGKLVSDKDSNATETETDHDDDDNNNNDDDDDDDDLELTRESKKKTKLTTKKAASFPSSSHFASKASKLMISDDDEKVINLENDDDDDENEDGDDERDDDLSSSVPSIRRSSRAHTSPARFE